VSETRYDVGVRTALTGATLSFEGKCGPRLIHWAAAEVGGEEDHFVYGKARDRAVVLWPPNPCGLCRGVGLHPAVASGEGEVGDKGLSVPGEAEAFRRRTYATGEFGEFFLLTSNPYVKDGRVRLRSKGAKRSEGEAKGRKGADGLAEHRTEFGNSCGRDVSQEEERNVVILRVHGRLKGEGAEEVVCSGGEVHAHGRRDRHGDEHALALGFRSGVFRENHGSLPPSLQAGTPEIGVALGTWGRTEGVCRMQKVIIVEGKTDQRRLEEVLAEPVTFLLTHGTLGEEELLRRLLPYEREDVYIFVDADEPGNRLRRLLGRWFPRAKHLYTRKIYREIAHTPLSHLARVLDEAHFAVREEWLLAWEREVNGKERGRRRRRKRNRHFDEEEGSEGRGT